MYFATILQSDLYFSFAKWSALFKVLKIICWITFVFVHGYKIPNMYSPSCGPPIIPKRAKAAWKNNSSKSSIKTDE